MFQILYIPKIGEDEAILTNIFQMGWFNHRLENDLHNLRCERSLHVSENISGGHEKKDTIHFETGIKQWKCMVIFSPLSGWFGLILP